MSTLIFIYENANNAPGNADLSQLNEKLGATNA